MFFRGGTGVPAETCRSLDFYSSAFPLDVSLFFFFSAVIGYEVIDQWSISVRGLFRLDFTRSARIQQDDPILAPAVSSQLHPK